MGKQSIRLWTFLAFVLALTATVWPVAGRLCRIREDKRQVAALENRVTALGEGERAIQRNLAKWYNLQLSLGATGLRGAYGNIMDLGDGAMALLEVPDLGLRLPIFHGYEGGVGHDPTTPFPIGGRGNHTVLVLSRSWDWEAGLPVYIDCLGERLSYRVEGVQVMPASWPTDRPTGGGEDLLTLVYNRGNTRTIVRCVRSSELKLRPQEKSPDLCRAAVLGTALALLGTFPGLWGRLRYAFSVQTPRICGFARKNRGKTKLF